MQDRWQIELAALPISWQVLGAAIDRSVLLDDPRASDTDEGGQLDSFLLCSRNKTLEHIGQRVDSVLPLDVLFIPMAPKREFPDFGLGKIGSRLEIELDHPGPDIGAADVCAEDSVKRPEHPRWRQMHGAQESGLVWIIMDRNQLDIDLLRLKKNGSPADDQFRRGFRGTRPR